MKPTKKLFIYLLLLSLSAGMALPALAFIGPSAGQTPGTGGGLFNVDANRNIGFGTSSSTPVSTFDNVGGGGGESHGYVFLVASTTNPGIGLKNTGLSHLYLWSVRNIGSQSRIDLYREGGGNPGKILMSIDQGGFVGISAAPTSTYRLYVGEGNIGTTGAFVGSVSGAVGAGNVSSGVFGSLQGNGNFAFPAALAVGTTTTGGLPTNGLFVAGNVGIGTTGPTFPLSIYKSTAGDYIELIGPGWASGGNPVGLIGYSAVGATSMWVANKYSDNAATFGIRMKGSAVGNEVFTILGSGNVGIGTTSPAELLEIEGTNDDAIARLDINNAFKGGIGAIYNAGTLGNDAVANDVVVRSDNNLILSLGGASTMYLKTGGNVGIATTTPVYGFDVVGTGRFTGQLTVPTPTADTSAATKGYVDSTVGGGSGTGSFATLTVSGTSTLATTGGKVGVGTATPNSAAKFNIVQGGDYNAGVVAAIIENGGVSNRATVRLRTTNDNPSEFAYDVNSALRWLISTRGSAESYKLNFYPQSGSPSYTSVGNAVFTIQQDGNVGIGTTGPLALLNIQSADSGVTPHANADELFIEGSGNSGLTIGSGTAGEGSIFFGDSGLAYQGQIVYSHNSDSMRFTTNNATAMTILSSGNVGIASTTPGYALTTVGTGYFSQPVVVGTPTTATHAATKSYVDSATVSQTGWTLSGTNVYLTSSTNSVGIGTVSPNTKLQVEGDISLGSAGTIIKQGGTQSQLDINPYQHLRIFRETNNTNADFYIYKPDGTGTTTNFFVDGGTNNVGIGTTAPSAKLQILDAGTSGSLFIDTTGVLGTGKLGTDFYSNAIQTGSSAKFVRLYLDNAGSNIPLLQLIQDGSGDIVQAFDGATQVFTIQDGGNVGIASSSPGYALTTVGTGYFSQPVIVGTPTTATHAATKSYVDSTVVSGSGWTDGGANVYLTTIGDNVGIGTASPGAKVHIVGDVIVEL